MPALEHREQPFDGVGVHGVAHVFVGRMLHGAMLGKELVGIAVLVQVDPDTGDAG